MRSVSEINDYIYARRYLDERFDTAATAQAIAEELRAGEKVFLDDITVDDVQNALQKPVRIVKSDGEEFIRVLCETYVPFYERENAYEQTDSGDSWEA